MISENQIIFGICIRSKKVFVTLCPNNQQKLTPPGNFEMLSHINKLDLCGFFYWMTNWPGPLFCLKKVHTSPAHLAVRAFQSCQRGCQLLFVVRVFNSACHNFHYTHCTENFTLLSDHQTLQCTISNNKHIENCTLHTSHCTLHSAHCTLHSAHCTLHTAHCTQPVAPYSLHNTHCTVFTTKWLLHTKH